jgi:hypothetical protein
MMPRVQPIFKSKSLTYNRRCAAHYSIDADFVVRDISVDGVSEHSSTTLTSPDVSVQSL